MSETTTIRVSRSTLAMLERVRRRFGASSLDEAIRLLVQQHRERTLERILGVDKGRVKPFSEEDRGEDRR